jgi:hypothetical protein
VNEKKFKWLFARTNKDGKPASIIPIACRHAMFVIESNFLEMLEQ